jgi:ketol-acid reductoisomerase
MEIDAWARRLEPFLDAGHPVLAIFRHDATGHATELAAALARAIGDRAAVAPDAAPSP